jgi:hypothetical protein
VAPCRPMKPTTARLFLTGLLGLAIATLPACGGAEPEPKAPTAKKFRKKQKREPVAEEPEHIPSKCLERKGACLPPIRWAERLCGEVYEDLALYMFRKGTPYTRYYMKTGLNAVNGWGPTIDENLVTGEEVLVINHRLRKDTVLVEGSLGTYDVLRWNGSCVTLDVNQVSKHAPRKKRRARIDWRSIDQGYQDLIMKDPGVAEAYEVRRKACRGASVGRMGADCLAKDGEFLDAVADFVRHESDLPEPKKYPDRD